MTNLNKRSLFGLLCAVLFVSLAPLISAADLQLSWNDNSNNEKGFIIQRSSGIGAPNFVEVARVGENITSYRDTGLEHATSYTYRVCAYNDAGASAFTDPATGTTVEAIPTPPDGLEVLRVTVTVSITTGDKSRLMAQAPTVDVRTPSAPPAAPSIRSP